MHTCAHTHTFTMLSYLESSNPWAMLFMDTIYIFKPLIHTVGVNSVFMYTQYNSVNLEVILQKLWYLGSWNRSQAHAQKMPPRMYVQWPLRYPLVSYSSNFSRHEGSWSTVFLVNQHPWWTKAAQENKERDPEPEAEGDSEMDYSSGLLCCPNIQAVIKKLLVTT